MGHIARRQRTLEGMVQPQRVALLSGAAPTQLTGDGVLPGGPGAQKGSPLQSNPGSAGHCGPSVSNRRQISTHMPAGEQQQGHQRDGTSPLG